MATRKAPSSLLAAAALLALLLSISPAVAFTSIRAPPALAKIPLRDARLPPAHAPSPLTKSTTTSLQMSGDSDTGGLERGKWLLLLAMVANVWIFSIPPEFRRARFCNEEDVRLHPEKNCMTFDMWKSGVAEYYANGGGIDFDFSIEGKE